MHIITFPLLALALTLPGPGTTPDEEFAFAFLRAGPAETTLSPADLATTMSGHFANMRRLGDEGVLLLAGPFGEPRGELRGIFLLDVTTPGEADRHVSSDPAVKAGVLDPLLVPFESQPLLRKLLALRRAGKQARAAQDPSQENAFEGRAYVLAMLADEATGTDTGPTTSGATLDTFLTSENTLFHGQLGGPFDGTLLACLDANDLDEGRRRLDAAGLGELPWDLHILWASHIVAQLPRMRLRSDAPHFAIQPLPQQGPRSAFRPEFDRLVDVFGIPIVATAQTTDRTLLHAAHCLAQYLDNNEDGQIDDAQVLGELQRHGAFLAMAESQQAFGELNLDWQRLEEAGFRLGQDLYSDETHPDGAPHADGAELPYDAALEEVLHLVSQGWARAHPSAFSFEPGSRLTQAMDLARGGSFHDLPNSFPDAAWYHYDDRTCHYECMAGEYFYWALTSLLGGQDFPGRSAAIANEWELSSPAQLARRDPAVLALLTDPLYRLPTRLPDGSYGK